MRKTCTNCGRKYNSNSTIAKFNSRFATYGVDYDEVIGGNDFCAECAIDETLELSQTGQEYFEAMDISQGEAPYNENNRFI